MTANPIDNPHQIAAEQDVIALWQDARVKAARDLVGRMWKTGWGDTPPDEVRPLIEPHIDEYMTNWLFKADVTPGESMCPDWGPVAVKAVLSNSPATLL